MTDTNDVPHRITLRDLPLAARLALSAFLISVGIGYISALVQLHFQQAKPGKPLPEKDDVERVYHGEDKVGEIERLIRADEHLPFNGSGSMRPAFFEKSAGWVGQVNKKAREEKIDKDKAKAVLRKEREREIEAILLWIKGGATKEGFDKQDLPDDFFKELPKPLENNFFAKDDMGKLSANVGEIFTNRCARCHADDKGGAAGEIHLANHDEVLVYVRDTESGGSSGMSLKKLAQTTHVHLLAFSMLYGLTGLILAFSSYPSVLRIVLCPLPLIAQVLEISCWWLGRVDPMFAHLIVYLGAVVAVGLMLHILLSLLNMYGVAGKLMLIVLIVAGSAGGAMVKMKVVDPFLTQESQRIEAKE